MLTFNLYHLYSPLNIFCADCCTLNIFSWKTFFPGTDMNVGLICIIYLSGCSPRPTHITTLQKLLSTASSPMTKTHQGLILSPDSQTNQESGGIPHS